MRARCTIASNIDIANTCKERYRMLSEIRGGSLCKSRQPDLEMHMLDLDANMRMLSSMLEHSSWIAEMVKPSNRHYQFCLLVTNRDILYKASKHSPIPPR